MGMQFEYDEKEGTFYYFLISFYALCLLPLTYYFWPQPEPKETPEQLKRKCHCEPCQMKRAVLKASSPWKSPKRKFIKVIFILLWIGFFYGAFQVSQIEYEWTEFDPFAELGVDRDATVAQVKKAYRQLSLKLHPDKGGDPKRFIRITKAFAALTNEESRKTWQEYGNPDGPGATQFGIALPKWIVDKKNSIWVLGAYVVVFMVILPISVGTWWYRRIKFDDHVLRNTTYLYFRFLSRSPTIAVKRVLMILAASYEFERSHNSEIVERPSDNAELTHLIRQLPHVNVHIREKPFCAVYATKARALLHAHLSRMELPANTLQQDKQILLKKCPWLMNEMCNVVAQIISTLAYSKGPGLSMPRIDTVVNIMRVSQMLVQALWENQSPLLQLPHMREDMLRHFVTKRRNIRTVSQLAEMGEEDRRALLRNLTDDQYRDLINVLATLPHVSMECHCEVADEEDSTITANSLITVTVFLKRRSLGEMFPTLLHSVTSNVTSNSGSTNGSVGGLMKHHRMGLRSSAENGELGDEAAAVGVYSNRGAVYNKPSARDVDMQRYTAATTPTLPVENASAGLNDDADGTGDDGPENNGQTTASSQIKSTKSAAVWEKNRNKRKGKKTKKPVKKSKQPQTKTANNALAIKDEPVSNPDEEASNGEEVEPEESSGVLKRRDEKEEQSHSSDSEGETGNNAAVSTSSRSTGGDDEWSKFQRQVRKENSLETKPRTTHLVHCPYFPAEKLEAWWIYVAHKKSKSLITQPMQICSLQTEEEVTLRFRPPDKPGQYRYTVYLRSDCYIDADVNEDIKIDVGEAVHVTDHPQWKLSDDEEKSDGDAAKGEVSDGAESEGSGTDYDYED